MARQLSLPTRRFSLAIVGKGWEGCYLDYRPLVPRDLLEIRALDLAEMDDATGAQKVMELAERHVAGGKVLVDNQLADYEQGDMQSLPQDVLGELFTVLTGGARDPKDIPPAPTPSSEPSSGSSS